jgi:hypothetical protein
MIVGHYATIIGGTGRGMMGQLVTGEESARGRMDEGSSGDKERIGVF